MKIPFLATKNDKNEAPQSLSEAQEALAQGVVSLKDIIAPSAIEVDFDFIKIGAIYFRTLFVVGYPRYVEANWLSPLIEFDHTLEISMFCYPVEAKGVLDELRRKIGEMEATIATDIQHGRVVDPAVQAALEDARALQEQLVKGVEKFFQLGLYITIPAETQDELERITKQVEATLGSLMIVTKHASLQHEDGFRTTLPCGRDHLFITRNMDTTSLATTFPFTSSELTANVGVMYGINEHNGSLIVFDRFSLENANSVVFAKAGAGKSVDHDEEVVYQDQESEIKKEKVGLLIERLIRKHGAQKIDRDLEGVILPGLKVFTFDQNLKGCWANVSVAARKKAPKKLYKFTTALGRKITTTADHNLIILKNGKIFAQKGSKVRVGNHLPLPRNLKIKPQKTKANLKLCQLLGYLISEGLITPKYTRVFNTDKEILNHLEFLAKSLKFDYSKFKKEGKIIGLSFKGESKITLRKLVGIGNSSQKKVPSFLFLASNQKAAKFLQTYFEGDGGIENHEVKAVTKSLQLASDLAYLLLRFGIVARISKKRKRATNAHHKGSFYYQISISGQGNLSSFAKNISFINKKRAKKLERLIGKKANTNVDLVPEIVPILNKIYQELYGYSEIKSPSGLSELKRNKFSPSRKLLRKLVAELENRILALENFPKNGFQKLASLPELKDLKSEIARDPEKNRQAWQTLGESWRLIKTEQVVPRTKNVLRLLKTVEGQGLELSQLKEEIYEGFQLLGESLLTFDKSLWTQITQRASGDTSYERLVSTKNFLKEKYKKKKARLEKIKEKVNLLRNLAWSDLFWDPIIKIEKVESRKHYVYDLTCDNGVFLAGFGGVFVHNSYMVKLEAMRSLMFGTEIIVIDPEEEYKTLTQAIGGEYIKFSFDSPAKINPFDLPGVYAEGENELGLKILSLHTLFKIIFGGMTATEDAILDRALILTYKTKGITQDPQTQKKEPPLMEDLYKVLIGMEEEPAKTLADKLEKFIKGSLAGIFDQRSTVDIKNTFTVFSIKDLEDELRPIAMFIILDYIWTRIKREMKKRILVVDEAWYLMKHPDSAIFLYSIAKRARKYYLGLTTITQDIEDFLSSDYGKAIVTNSSIQILLKQSPAAIDKIAQVFYLSEGEKHLLLAADIGEGLFFAGPNHVAIRVVASPDEHKLVTTKPQELLEMRGQAPQQTP
jgi:intein/homing endonuclease